MRSSGSPGHRQVGPRPRRAGTAPLRAALLSALVLANLVAPLRADDPSAAPDLAARLGEAWRWRSLGAHPGDGVLRTLRSGGDGETLFASDGDDLHLYDGHTWTTIPNRSEGYWSIRSALPHEGGFLLSTDSNLSTWHDERGEHVLVGRESAGLVTRPARDASGRILVGFEGRIHELRDGALVPRLDVPAEGGRLWDLVTGPGGDVLALMQHGLYRLSGDASTRLDTAGLWPDWPRPEFVATGDGHVYILSRSFSHERPGLVWDGRQLHVLPPPPVDGVEIIEDAAVRPDGTLLLATRHARLLLLRDGLWTQAPPAPPVDREYIASACFVGDRLAVLTASGQTFACDTASERWRVHGLPGGKADRTIVNALYPLDDGRMWATTEEGVGLWTGGGWSEFHREAGEGGHDLAGITTICVDARGHLWLASGSAFPGAFEYDGQHWTHHRERALGFDRHPIHRIVRGPDDALWFSLLASSPADSRGGGGLVRRSEAGWTRFTTADGLPHDRCYDVAFTPDGRTWVGTSEGLGRLDGERWLRIEEPGLPMMLIFSLFVDSGGRLFVGRGLQVAGVWRRHTNGTWRQIQARGRARACAAQFAEDTQGQVYFSSDSGLFRVDGDVAIELTAPHAAPVANFWPVVSDGRGGLWLGSRGDGLVHFTPDDQDSPKISRFEPWASPTDGSVVIEWEGADHWNQTLSHDLHAEIRVDGGAWSPGSRMLHPTTPGPYRVDLRLSDECGNVSTVVSKSVIVPDTKAVRHALQVSGVFLLMALAVVGGSAWLRSRERRVERQRLKNLTLRRITSQEDERRRLSRDLHDDLGQLLTAATLELQLAQRAGDEDGRRRAHDRALATVRQALERARKFSAVLRPRMLDELGLAQALSAALSEFHERTGLQVVEDLDLGPERVPEPLAGHAYRIVQEALTNALRHARATRVRLSARVQNGQLELEFEDDGVGFDFQGQRPRGGQGLDIMAERATQVGGRLTIESRPGKGTRIRLFAPLGFVR